MEEIMLKIDNVSKMYRLGQIGGTTLRDELQRKMAKLRKKEDPTRKIGSKDYISGETFLALNGVSFEVKKGERVGIIGHNGAGKSTLLKLISRVTAPSSGRIQMNGRVASMLEVGTGFHGELTGRENIYMNGAILGMSKKEIDAKMEDIIEFSECRQFIDTPVKRYSSGMYVKLAFSVAAHLDSEIMIMDEVLAVGDMAFQKKCLDKMNGISRTEGRTILYVSHNMNTIRQLCDRVVVLEHGNITFDGDVEKGIEKYSAFSDDDNGIEYDLSNKKMVHIPSIPIAKMKYLKILNKEVPVFTSNEKLEFLLDIIIRQEIKNLSVRLEIRSYDDVPIGVSFFENIEPKAEVGILSERMSFDLNSLTRGKYKTLLVLYQKNQLGGYYDFDAVLPAFYFEISDDFDIDWNINAWGHVRFPAMNLLPEGKRKSLEKML